MVSDTGENFQAYIRGVLDGVTSDMDSERDLADADSDELVAELRERYEMWDEADSGVFDSIPFAEGDE